MSKVANQEDEVNSNSSPPPRPSLKRGNSILDCIPPDPPSTVFAIGRHESAEVWWTKDYDLEKGTEILEWEITRYRKDRKNGKVTWSNKGSMVLLQLGKIHQCIFYGLKTHCEYRFTVTIKTINGYSMESPPSNMVYVDAPPPVGWKLCYDRSTKQYYYYNEFFRTSQISRPEEDPLFIENHVAKSFSKRELKKFKEIWIEEMMHFEMMSHTRLQEVLSELGEEVPTLMIRDHMKAFVRSETVIETFKGFMDILQRIKRDLIEASKMRLSKKHKKKREAKSIPGYKIGDWSAHFHRYSQRWRFQNSKALFNITDTWDMTWEARFYMSEEEFYDVHECFDFGMVERIRAQFDEINVAKNGTLSMEELDMFLIAVGAIRAHHDKKEGLIISRYDRSARKAFFRQMDDNANGYVTFNEFIMMLRLLVDKKKCTGLMKKIRDFEFLKVLSERGVVKVPMSPSVYKAKLVMRKQKADLLKRIEKKKREDEKIANEQDTGKSKRNRRRKYEVRDDDSESKGATSIDESVCDDDTDDDINRYVGSNYEAEELDELRAIAPPEVTNCVAFLQVCSCCCMEYVESIMDSLNISRTKGPHGAYCLCGCRGHDTLRRDIGF
mmetsp:Transcript_6039/g.11518  ORF Transcript_6039/g.11518 Transcript_6039/m.11518 type:complete len:610 (+) Transcript_6039:55-1884(+)